MKKTLIAAAIAALTAGTAQAITLHESEAGSFSTYGKIQLQLNNYDGENEIQDNGSRLGFHGHTQLDNGLSAFANAEFRFNAGYKNDAQMTVRNSFVGVEGDFGRIRAGNFDSLYYNAVSSVTDVMEQDGWRALGEDSTNAHGFALAYETGDVGGFAFGLAAKHYNSDESRNGAGYPSASNSGNQEWNLQAYVQLTLIDNLVLALAADQNNGKANGGSDEPIFGLSATYTLDALTASALFEIEDDLTHFAVAAEYSLGATSIYGTVSFLDDDTDSGIDFALGASHHFASNFYLYGEVAVGNNDLSEIQDANGKGTQSVTIGAAYRW